VLLNQTSLRPGRVHGAARLPGLAHVQHPGRASSTVTTPADLKGVPIGISQNTVIEYLTDRMLQAEGLDPADIAITEVAPFLCALSC